MGKPGKYKSGGLLKVTIQSGGNLWTRRISLGLYETELAMSYRTLRENMDSVYSGQDVGHLVFSSCFDVSNYNESKKAKKNHHH